MSTIQSNRIKHPVKGITIKVEDTQTGQIYLYDSLREAGKGLNCNHMSMKYNLDNGKLYKGRYLIIAVKP